MRESSTRRTWIKTAGALAAAGLAGCSGGDSGSDNGTTVGSGTSGPSYTDITVSIWGGPTAETHNEVFYQPFAEEHGIEVSINEHGNAFDVLSKVRSGQEIHGGAIDQFGAVAAYDDGMLVPMDEGVKSKLDIFQEKFREPTWDPGEELHTAMDSLFVGSGFYNTDAVSDLSTWDDILMNDAFSNRFALISNAAHYLPYTMGFSEGINLNNLANVEDDSELMDPVWEKLRNIKPNATTFTNDGNVFNLMSSGSVDAGQLSAADTQRVAEDSGIPYEPYVPEGGVWGDATPWMVFGSTTNADQEFTMMRLIESTLDRKRRREYAEQLPYAQGLDWGEGGVPYPNNPELVHSDRIFIPDPAVVNPRREEWLQKTQEIIGG